MPAPRSSRFDDVYFSDQDGLAESTHVFLLGNQLPERLGAADKFTVFETGFGTGLNIINLWQLWDNVKKPHGQLHIYSVEKYPLSSSEISDALNPWRAELGNYIDALITHYPLRIGGWHTLHIAPDVTLTLIFDDVNHVLPECDQKIDAWFLDGFAPAKNPDMWSDVLFKNMARTAHQGTTFSTFTAAGFVRRGLSDAGFDVEKQSGFGRKRDMLRGVFKGTELSHTAPASFKKIAVIGGGLAGTSIARVLHHKNCDVTLFEKKEIASGSSGNNRGLFNPRFSQARNAQSEFYASAFQLAHRLFEKLADEIDYFKTGSVHLFTDAEKEKRLKNACENWGWHDDHMRILTAQDSAAQTQVNIDKPCLFLPDAGSINPKKLCENMARNVRMKYGDIILSQTESAWRVNDELFDVVIIAGGSDVMKMEQCQQLPLQSVRGQIITAQSDINFNTNICYGGYCAPSANGNMVVGSTFQPWLDNTEPSDDDTQTILKNLFKAVPSFEGRVNVTGARASLRCAAKDRFPVVGEMAGQPNLYISTAHGSHGILSALLSAEILASHIMKTPQILPTSTIRALSPSRFQVKN